MEHPSVKMSVEDNSAMTLEGYRCMDFKRNSISFALKHYDPPKNLYSRGKSQSFVKRAVLTSPRIGRIVREVAENSGTSIETVQAEAQSIVDEIAHKMALPAVRTIASMLRSVLTRVLDAIYVNTGGLELLARTVTDCPVILLPSHRSYLDFILVSYVMFEHDITLPCIAAGQDFMSMWGVSPFLRRSGAFFLRRTFGSDRLYKAVFSEYVKAVLCSGDCPMEFFVEGTRSRSGKSLHPRLGLLSMVIEPYLSGSLPDIMIVPISISYERTLEELLFARELLGVPKPKESTTALFRAHSVLSENYGSIFFDVGKPISLHDVCLDCGISRIPHCLLPREMSGLLPHDWKVVEALGDIVLERLHCGMKIFPTSLVATVLLQQPHGIKLDELVDLTWWVEQQVTNKGGQVAKLDKDRTEMVSAGLAMLTDAVCLTSNLVTVANPQVISEQEQTVGPSSMSEIMCSQISDSCFSQLSQTAMTYLRLAYYRNQLLHLFVEDAMLALCLAPQSDYATVQEVFSAVHCAVTSEFVLPRKSSTEVLDEVLDRFLFQELVHENWESKGRRRLLHVKAAHYRHMKFLRGLMLPFVAGVWVVCHHLLSLDGGVQSLSATVKAAQQLSAKCLRHGMFPASNNGLLDCYEILSLGMVKNALSSLHEAGLTLQASSEFGTGKDRLVKVIETEKLMNLAAILGPVVAPQFKAKL